MAEHDILPSNSNKLRSIGVKNDDLTRSERPHATKIATRVVNTKPDSVGKRFIKLFLAEDVDNIGEYLVKDLIIPGAKDVFFNFLWALFWGDKRTGSSIGRSDRTPYYKASQTAKIRTIGSSEKREKEPEETKNTPKFDLSNLRFMSQAEAKEVLTAMKVYLDSYPGVSIGYLQELLGETGDYTNEYYGWTNLEDARIRPTSGGGWLLVLPRPERL